MVGFGLRWSVTVNSRLVLSCGFDFRSCLVLFCVVFSGLNLPCVLLLASCCLILLSGAMLCCISYGVFVLCCVVSCVVLSYLILSNLI